MDIEFQPSTGLGTKRLNHMLDFDGSGKTQSILMEVASDDPDQALAIKLAAELDRLNLSEERKQQ